MDPQVFIRLLGVPEVAGSATAAPFPAKGFQLLALICRSPAARISRREAASLLWNSGSDGEALTNLRQLLMRIRRFDASTQELIASDQQWLTLGAAFPDIDILLFQSLTSQMPNRDAQRALELFRGDLLAGAGDFTNEFAQWLLPEREALRACFFSAAASVLIDLTRFGRAPADELRAIAQRMLALEPDREASYRLLIEAYGRNGMFAEADKIMKELKQVLRREFGAEPSAETIAVSRRVMASARDVVAGEPQAERNEDVRPRIAFLAPYSVDDAEAPRIVRALIEDVANELTRYRTFAVLAPHSSFQVAHDSGLPVDNAALRAGYTISGFLRREAAIETLTLRLVKCSSQEILWALEIPLEADQLAHSFRILAMRVAASLAAELERDSLSQALDRNTAGAAYRRYLEGQVQMQACTLPSLRRAQRAYRDSAAQDPSFAAARARIGQTLYLEWLLLGGSDPHLLIEARKHADAAVALDAGAALGHWMSAVVGLYQRDFGLSAEKFSEAEALNPNSADLLVQHADALSHFGRPDEGWSRFERAVDLNPLPPDHYWWAGAGIAFNRQDFTRTVALCGRMANDEPVLRLLTATHALLGDIETARSYGQRVTELYPGERAADMVKAVPNRDDTPGKLFIEGLRLAGIS
ncbi:BTAD domain-containing putative transcriptional regulator [Dongia sp. agr-C8]